MGLKKQELIPSFVSQSGDTSSKIVNDFSNKVVKKLKLSTNYFFKRWAPKQSLFIGIKSDGLE